MRKKRVLFNIISAILLQMSAIICGFIVHKIIIYNYGSNVNGVVASITKFLAYISFLELGFGPVINAALYKPVAQKNKTEILQILKTSEKFFKMVAYVFLIYIFVLCLTYPILLSNEFSIQFTIPLIIIIAISTFAEYYFGMAYRLYLKVEQKSYVFSIIQIITLVLSTVVAVIFVKIGATIHIVKLSTAIIFMFRPIFQNWHVRKKYDIDLKNVKCNYDIKQKWDAMAQHIAFIIHSNTDIIILSICCTMTEVSVYSVYLLVVSSIKNIIQSFSNGVDAAFGEMFAKGQISELNKSMKIYEIIYFTIITVVFSVTLFLITPFVKIYTRGITDVNYVRPVFGYLIVISEYVWAIREPYNMLTKVVGHFKETKKGAWAEAIANGTISIVLVWKFGLAGVAIGTMVAMAIRTIDLMRYTDSCILKRSHKYNIKNVFVMFMEMGLITVFVILLPKFQGDGYLEWGIQAAKVSIIAGATVLAINLIAYKENVKEIVDFIRIKLNSKC